MKVLVLCDDYWHPGEVVQLGLAPLESSNLQFEFVNCCKDILTVEKIRNYPLIINCKMNEITSANNHPWFDEGVTEVAVSDFCDYVENGGGFLSLHAGNAYFNDKAEDAAYVNFVGNYFIQHPPRCDMEVRITAQHPVTQGVGNFTLRDEHYEIAVVADNAQTICTTHSATGGDQIGGYVREIGKGRMCVLTPGHILDVWHNPEYQKMLINAMRWCAGES